MENMSTRDVHKSIKINAKKTHAHMWGQNLNIQNAIEENEFFVMYRSA